MKRSKGIMIAEEMNMVQAVVETEVERDQAVEAVNKRSTSMRNSHVSHQTQGEIQKVDHTAKVARKPEITSKIPNTTRDTLLRRQRRISSISLTKSCWKSLRKTIKILRKRQNSLNWQSLNRRKMMLILRRRITILDSSLKLSPKMADLVQMCSTHLLKVFYVRMTQSPLTASSSPTFNRSCNVSLYVPKTFQMVFQKLLLTSQNWLWIAQQSTKESMST